MSVLLYRLGHACARHRRVVIGTWVVLVIALIAGSRIAGSQTSDDLTLPGTGSTNASNVLATDLPHQQYGSVPIVLESGSGKLTDAKNKPAVKAAVDSLSQAPGVRKAVSPLSEEGASALSKDETIGYVSLTLSIGPSDLSEDDANEIIDAAQPATDAGLEVSAGGYLGQEVSKPSTHLSEALGIGAAIVILLFAFGAAAAMALPIATAVVAVGGGLSLIALLGHVTEMSTVAPTLGTMIGLGVGIDYSLFIITRYREKLAQGVATEEAIARTLASTGSAVLFAGSTVVIALVSLALAKIPIVTSLGIAAALVVVVAVSAAMTLLPALLALLGPRIDSLRVPFAHRRAKDARPHGWARWALEVARRPWPSILLAVVVLVALALPVLDLRLGQEDVGELPESTTARQAYDAITDGFGVGTNGQLLVAVKLDPPAHNDQSKLDQLNQQQQQAEQAAELGEAPPPTQAQPQKTAEQKQFLQSTASDPRLVRLEKRIGKAKDVTATSAADVGSSGKGAVFGVTPRTAPSDFATQDVVNDLRDNVIPAASGNGATAYVGGTTAGYIDLGDRIGDKLVQVIAIVVALSFLLLMLAFRSVVVPLTAGLMNLLSVAAAYGVLTAVFEKGWGNELIGLDTTIPVESFVPLLMFAILFGLSMDYQVFLLSRIHEHFGRDGDNRKAVIDGVATSGRVITSAALIMVTVFASFILNGDPTVKQFGVGLAVAIALDATIVRCLLVPAVMVVFGRANWWLPRWLDRALPEVGLESEDSLPPIEQPAKPEAPRPPVAAPGP